ncbi:MAG: long-chain fatty acid--CoA ligase [Gammaproteobacteria bacterium]|nr:long-chain fatty acid--CoA ligase [Gammaproteobacteria bacterium]MYC99927.1 long-chain fatty acid--CoA ligase [Gammaproteobacteria bacterium]
MNGTRLRDDLIGVMGAGVGTPLSDADFDDLARRISEQQWERNPVFARFCAARGVQRGSWSSWHALPPVPTRAFRDRGLVSRGPAQAVFRTSGTTGGAAERGEHRVPDLSLYHASLLPNFEAHLLPDGARLPLISLIPSPLEVRDSSLSHMIGVVEAELVAETGYFVDRDGRLDEHGLRSALRGAEGAGDPVLVVGTAFAFVHLLDALATDGSRFRLPDGSRVMETGGFKGRSRTVPRKELYAAIDSRLGIPSDRIVNEYGMTELLSQFYEPVLTGGPRLHHPPPWVRTRVLDPATLDPLPPGREGLLCHFDLANLGSVCCVLTEDLGVEPPEAEGEGFRVLGRNAGAEPRGCSLAMDDLMTALRGPAR